MRHFDAWLVRDPYSIWHYYSTGRVWQDTVRDLIHDRSICSPAVPTLHKYKEEEEEDKERDNKIQDDNRNEDQGIINWSTHTPQSTPLLTKLPPEIRSMIWSYVFGSSTLHLVQIKDKIKHVRCASSPGHASSSTATSTDLTHHRHCCPLTPARWRIYDGRIPGHTDRLLYPHTHELLPNNLSDSNVALLSTCKQIYAETQTLLYKNNTIDVDDLSTFLSFSSSLSPRALHSISSLTIQWTPIWTPLSGAEHTGSIYAHTHSDVLWLSFWRVVSSMRGLRKLKLSIDLGRFSGAVVGGGVVVLSGQNSKLPLGVGEAWVQPILQIRGLAEFDLAVTVRCDGVVRGVVEEGLVRDVLKLREGVRGVVLRDREWVDCMDLDVDIDGREGKQRGRKRMLSITAG